MSPGHCSIRSGEPGPFYFLVTETRRTPHVRDPYHQDDVLCPTSLSLKVPTEVKRGLVRTVLPEEEKRRKGRPVIHPCRPLPIVLNPVLPSSTSPVGSPSSLPCLCPVLCLSSPSLSSVLPLVVHDPSCTGVTLVPFPSQTRSDGPCRLRSRLRTRGPDSSGASSLRLSSGIETSPRKVVDLLAKE